MDYPQLYMKIKENRLMSWKTFIIWFIQGNVFLSCFNFLEIIDIIIILI